MNIEALKNAEIALSKNLGDISDLPEELQNTIANIYYKSSTLTTEQRDLALQNGIKGINKHLKDASFYITSIKMLPEIIRWFREVVSEGNKQVIKTSEEMFLLMFKYKMLSKRKLLSYPMFYIKILKYFSRSKVDEIPGLYKIMIEHDIVKPVEEKSTRHEYKTFEKWYCMFKKVAGQRNSQLEVDGKGESLIDFMENEPLKRAFSDGIDPETLALSFADQFNITTFADNNCQVIKKISN